MVSSRNFVLEGKLTGEERGVEYVAGLLKKKNLVTFGLWGILQKIVHSLGGGGQFDQFRGEEAIYHFRGEGRTTHNLHHHYS